MKLIKSTLFVAVATLALAACGEAEEEAPARTGVLAVGSSTVFPFAEAVAEAARRADPAIAEISIESTGTADGIAAFCAGNGLDTPDIANASRRMTAQEFAGCTANGVTEIVEIRVGTDGIAFVSARDEGISMDLSRALLYRALAATPFGEEQTAMNWRDLDPSLPDDTIEIYGPAASSGTLQSLRELVLEAGCRTNGSMAALQNSNPDEFVTVCSSLRSDSAFRPQGEDDDLIVRKVASNEHAIAVVGYSWFEENQGAVKALSLDGFTPTAETIADGSYPASRPLYIYVKKAHMAQIPGLRTYLDQWVANWGAGGPLEAIGLVASPADVLATAAAAARDLPVLTAEMLGGE